MGNKLDRKGVLAFLMEKFRSSYDITEFGEESLPLVARCDYFEHTEKYVLSRKANLWSADGEEFLYLFDVAHLTKEIYQKCMDTACEDGMNRLHNGPGHMYSYITAEIVCESCDSDVIAAVKKSRRRKSFHFSFHGWMEYRSAVICCNDDTIISNAAGRNVAKILKKVLYSKR